MIIDCSTVFPYSHMGGSPNDSSSHYVYGPSFSEAYERSKTLETRHPSYIVRDSRGEMFPLSLYALVYLECRDNITFSYITHSGKYLLGGVNVSRPHNVDLTLFGNDLEIVIDLSIKCPTQHGDFVLPLKYQQGKFAAKRTPGTLKVTINFENEEDYMYALLSE